MTAFRMEAWARLAVRFRDKICTALLAGAGAGVWRTVSEPAAATSITAVEKPDPVDAGIYHRLYPHFRALCPALKRCFDQLVGIRSPE